MVAAVLLTGSSVPQFNSFSHSHQGAGTPHSHAGLFPFGHLDAEPAPEAQREASYVRSAAGDSYSESVPEHDAILGFLNTPRVATPAPRAASVAKRAAGPAFAPATDRHVHNVVQNNVPMVHVDTLAFAAHDFSINGWFQRPVSLHQPVLSLRVRGPPSVNPV